MQADISMSSMLETLKDAKAVCLLALTTDKRMIEGGAPIDQGTEMMMQLPAKLQLIISFIEQQNKFDEMACIRYSGFNEFGHNMAMGVRSSADPNKDIGLMVGFLELNDAFAIRNVPVRHKLGSLWLTSEVPPEDNEPKPKDANAALHAAVRNAIDLAEASGKVLSVYSKSNPFEHRMGGHYMTYELRDNLAVARKKAAEPCKIVRGSNYDEEVFFERFWADGEVLTRDAATVKAKELNDDPKRDDSIYWRVVDCNYELRKWEP